MEAHFFGACTVRVFPAAAHVSTLFEDGTTAEAARDCEVRDRPYAERLGYRGDDACWNALREHELAHTYLAERMGKPYSPVLWAVAHGANSSTDPDAPYHLQLAEEAVVLSFQRYLNTREIEWPLRHPDVLRHLPEWASDFCERFRCVS